MSVAGRRGPGTTADVSIRTLLVEAPLVAGEVVVSGAEARHGAAVLRLRPGDAVRLADGDGRAGVGAVVSAEADTVVVQVDRVEDLVDPAIAAVTVACALPKGDLAGDLVRMLSELGVGALRPLRCARGVRVEPQPRLARISLESLKQCRRGRPLSILPALDVAELAAGGGRIILADAQGGRFSAGAPGPLTVAVGPEGGFTADETAALVAAGAETFRLAPHVLRIETAAVSAAAVLAAAWEHP